MGTEARSWATDGPVTSPFAKPAGILGRLAGRFMLWTNQQADLLEVLHVRPGQQVLEIGYGPGGLVRLLVERTDAALIRGIDPSPVMRDQATKVNRAAVDAGQAELGLGSAEQTGLVDQCVDLAISVNNVAIWPNLEAGLREMRRVLRPGGTLVIAWHGGSAPSPIGKRLRLAEDKLRRIETSLHDLFAKVTRQQLKTLDVFVGHAAP